MSTRGHNKGDDKRPLIDTLVHLARRATGVPTAPLARDAVEAAVRGFVLAPSGRRRDIAREVIAEAAAVIVADLVHDAPAPDTAPGPRPAPKSAVKSAVKPTRRRAAAAPAAPRKARASRA